MWNSHAPPLKPSRGPGMAGSVGYGTSRSRWTILLQVPEVGLASMSANATVIPYSKKSSGYLRLASRD
ncbi:hypothetical protein FHS20_003916 [Phyllobacterium endophyticum]|nr:hypothetical protein [Phyllobacterium endophyticum]